MRIIVFLEEMASVFKAAIRRLHFCSMEVSAFLQINTPPECLPSHTHRLRVYSRRRTCPGLSARAKQAGQEKVRTEGSILKGEDGGETEGRNKRAITASNEKLALPDPPRVSLTEEFIAI